MRYYVYALIDPTRNCTPFYIGKGLDNRLQSHFVAAEKVSDKEQSQIVGCDTSSVIEDATTDRVPERLQRIAELTQKDYSHSDIARIIARRMDEQTALAVEAYLIRRVYGICNLTNKVEGSHGDRYREYGHEEFIPDFDMDTDLGSAGLAAIEQRWGRHYVYTLRDPRTGCVFYVGEGTGRRMFAHFADAVQPGSSREGHLCLLAELIRAGVKPREIGRVEARVGSKQQSLALEALLMKFVHGFATVENQVAGHHAEIFRAKDDWERRRGFDLPYICDPGQRVDRSDKRDGMIGEGLAIPLFAVAANFPELRFDPPKVLDSADLSIEADVVPASGGAGTRIKVFIGRRKLQVELRPRKKAQKEWTREHFTRLGAFLLLRGDLVFIPDVWRGSANMTDDPQVITDRVRIMQEIVNTKDINSLSPENRSLLQSRIS